MCVEAMTTVANKFSLSVHYNKDSFTFTPIPSKYDTDVRISVVDGKKLVFECTYSFEDRTYGGQVGVRTVTVRSGLLV